MCCMHAPFTFGWPPRHVSLCNDLSLLLHVWLVKHLVSYVQICVVAWVEGADEEDLSC